MNFSSLYRFWSFDHAGSRPLPLQASKMLVVRRWIRRPSKILRLNLILSLSRGMFFWWVYYFSLVWKSCINIDFDSAVSGHFVFSSRGCRISGLFYRELFIHVVFLSSREILGTGNKIWVCHLIQSTWGFVVIGACFCCILRIFLFLLQ
jgi:hypothetical protein